jgi:hypothetical protein
MKPKKQLKKLAKLIKSLTQRWRSSILNSKRRMSRLKRKNCLSQLQLKKRKKKEKLDKLAKEKEKLEKEKKEAEKKLSEEK